MVKRSILILIMVLAVAGMVNAATEAEKQAAIDAGLAWLASQQQADGRWNMDNAWVEDSDTGATAAALLAFAEEGNTINGGTYQSVVQNGVNYLMSRATTYGIGGQPAGNPDVARVNGLGVKFVPGGDNGRDIYVTGLAVPAIVKATAKTNTVSTGPLTGWTYENVVKDTVDYLAYAQNEAGNTNTWKRGGWRYYANYSSSDNSTSQWPIVALDYAKQWGINAPAFVESELDHWIGYIQNPGDGGSYYDNNFGGWGSNVSRTGTLLLEMEYSNWDNEAAHSAAYNAALAYMDNQWNTGVLSTWNGNFGHPYAMWASYKGLQSTIGLTGNLDPPITPRAQGGAPIDAGDVWNWWEDYCEYLVTSQNTFNAGTRTVGASASWSGYSYWETPLATAWYINILNATTVVEPPAPTAVLLGLIGLGYAGRKLRRFV